MATTLMKATLENIRSIMFAEPNSVHARDAQILLDRWAQEGGLEMDPETRALLEAMTQKNR